MSWGEEDLKRKGFIKNPDGSWTKEDRQPLVKAKEKPVIPKDLSHCLFIPGHVPSSKNGRRNFQPKDKNGNPLMKENGKMKTISLKSVAVVKYISESQRYWERYFQIWQQMIKDLPLPLHVKFHFARKTKANFDWINPTQTVQDIMVKFGYIQDDNTKCLKPSFGEEWVDKDKPGVYIEVIKD